MNSIEKPSDREATIEALFSFLAIKNKPSTMGQLKVNGGYKTFMCPDVPLADLRSDFGLPWISKTENVTPLIGSTFNYTHLILPGPDTDGRFQIVNCRAMPSALIRGKQVFFAKENIACSRLWLDERHNTMAQYLFSYSSSRKKFVINDAGIKDDDFIRGEIEGQTNIVINVMSQLGFMRRSSWVVKIWEDDNFGISFDMNPDGAKELFRFRDVPNGKKRRTMLRNWVSEHWRKKDDKAPEDWTHVIKHLRGATRFLWHGLNVQFNPSHDAKVELSNIKTSLCKKKEDAVSNLGE